MEKRFFYIRAEFKNPEGQGMFINFGVASEGSLTNTLIKEKLIEIEPDAENIDITFFYEFLSELDYDNFWEP